MYFLYCCVPCIFSYLLVWRPNKWRWYSSICHTSGSRIMLASSLLCVLHVCWVAGGFNLLPSGWKDLLWPPPRWATQTPLFSLWWGQYDNFSLWWNKSSLIPSTDPKLKPYTWYSTALTTVNPKILTQIINNFLHHETLHHSISSNQNPLFPPKKH